MIRVPRLAAADRSGTAAVELALVLPFLLIIIFGSVELGNYFLNEHTLIKAVRDGSRYAARQPFASYTGCGSASVDSTVVANTKAVVKNGFLSGGTILTPRINDAAISVTTGCATAAGGQTMTGIYNGRANGAQIVTVSATVNYRPVLNSFGFRGSGRLLNATSQAAVTGI